MVDMQREGFTELEFKGSAQVYLRQKPSKGGDQLQLMLAIARAWHRTDARTRWPDLFNLLGPSIDALIWQWKRKVWRGKGAEGLKEERQVFD
eukprot:6466023-Amphidinium_carterae.2